MTNWVRKLDLKDVWNIEEEGEPVAALAKTVAERLNKLETFDKPVLNTVRENLITRFSEYAEKGDRATFHGFNRLMAQLYDWGDLHYDEVADSKLPFSQKRKVCWIATF